MRIKIYWSAICLCSTSRLITVHRIFLVKNEDDITAHLTRCYGEVAKSPKYTHLLAVGCCPTSAYTVHAILASNTLSGIIKLHQHLNSEEREDHTTFNMRVV